MPFVPFTKKSASAASGDSQVSSAAPAFAKKSTKRRSRKTGKVAPAQKSLMQSGRSMSGGGR